MAVGSSGLKKSLALARGALRPSSFTYPLWTTSGLEGFESSVPGHSRESSLLARTFTSRGSDKATAHDYHVPYAYLMSLLPVGPLLEIGIGTTNPSLPSTMGPKGTVGASLRAWMDLGKFSHIYGADIDEATLFTEPGISTFPVDQCDMKSLHNLRERLAATNQPGFSLIVDDGLHTAEANIRSLNALFELLMPGGIYAIEDIPAVELGRILEHVSRSALGPWACWSNPFRSHDTNLILVLNS